MYNVKLSDFRNQSQQIKWLKVLCWVSIVIITANVFYRFSGMEHFLRENKGYNSIGLLILAALLNVLKLLYLITVYCCYKWLYRTNYNARALGANNMKFSPAWSIGWFFIPIANLWKPYQALKEIFKVSEYYNEAPEKANLTFLKFFWSFMMLDFFLMIKLIFFGSSFDDVSNNQLISSNKFMMLYTLWDIIHITLLFCIIHIARYVYNLQKYQYEIIINNEYDKNTLICPTNKTQACYKHDKRNIFQNIRIIIIYSSLILISIHTLISLFFFQSLFLFTILAYYAIFCLWLITKNKAIFSGALRKTS